MSFLVIKCLTNGIYYSLGLGHNVTGPYWFANIISILFLSIQADILHLIVLAQCPRPQYLHFTVGYIQK